MLGRVFMWVVYGQTTMDHQHSDSTFILEKKNYNMNVMFVRFPQNYFNNFEEIIEV